jgi:hypothetical protein
VADTQSRGARTAAGNLPSCHGCLRSGLYTLAHHGGSTISDAAGEGFPFKRRWLIVFIIEPISFKFLVYGCPACTCFAVLGTQGALRKEGIKGACKGWGALRK